MESSCCIMRRNSNKVGKALVCAISIKGAADIPVNVRCAFLIRRFSFIYLDSYITNMVY